ncbi:MAG: hemerythrin family protein [Eubacteriales bacterium]|nr:hemerythrin family protein [Eubacteriales bacterium]
MRAEFTDNLITGNTTIDNQHRELIDKINQLLQAIETSRDKAVAVKTLNFLTDYIHYHFQAEEKLQEETGYPGLEDHKKQHEILNNTVADLTDMLEEEEGPSDAFVAQLNKKVIEWFYRHIEGFDRSVAEYIFLLDNPERL